MAEYPVTTSLWLVGNRRSDTLGVRAVGSARMLWLVGNRRSDTLQVPATQRTRPLWLVGNPMPKSMITWREVASVAVTSPVEL